MKIISWNVNGIRAAWGHGLSQLLDRREADLYAFQETKTDVPIRDVELAGYHAYWSFCESRKGYSGTLCLSREEPIRVEYGMGDLDFDDEGRIITLEYEPFFFVNCYVPNSQRSAERRDYREAWDALLIAYLRMLKVQKPVIVCGDFNVPLEDRDIYRESKWVEINAEGFQSTERENLVHIIRLGFVDSYRLKHPRESGKFTWWSNRRNKRMENRGWRLDYFLVSEDISGKITESTMLSKVYGSDHCPILLDMELEVPGEDAGQSPETKHSYTYEELLQLEKQMGVCACRIVRQPDMSRLWDTVDWQMAEEHLCTLQMALAKSAYTGDYGLIEKWQKKVVYSVDAKLLAVRHVCNTASSMGIDCVKWSTSHEKASAAMSLTSKGYRAMPSRLLLIKCKNGKQRRIHIETYYDRAMQTLYAYSLDPVAESWGERKSFAYRRGRSAYDMNEYIKQAFSGGDAPEWVLAADVRRCYETISHDWIMQHIPLAPSVLFEFLHAGYIFAGKMFPTDMGVGIGCSISPIIANMVLDGLQEHIYKNLYPDGNIDYRNGNLIRYADDIIVSARDEKTAIWIRHCIRLFLEERGLELSGEKTKILPVSEGFTFLSRTYFKRDNQLQACPSQAAVEKFMRSMKDLIERYTGSQKSLITKINRKIDGWVTYHKVSEAEEAFRRMDVYINALLLDLCEKKHPKWKREKILERYWFVDAEGRHCYALPDKKEVRVKFLADTLYVDYSPIWTKANPYIDLEYMEHRSDERKIMSVTGVYRSIWNRQEGRCYYCGKKILRDEKKILIEADASQPRKALRMAYVHERCQDGSFDYVDTDLMPCSLDEVMDLLLQLDGMDGQSKEKKYYVLSEYFRTCEKNSVTLTFAQIEEMIGQPLGASALRPEFWYRTGFGCISQCWLDNGYEIRNLHLEAKKRVVFHLADAGKKMASVSIPAEILYGRIPVEAKYELENYLHGYFMKKYGL